MKTIESQTVINRLKKQTDKIRLVEEPAIDSQEEIEAFVSNIETAITSQTLVPVICEDMYEYEDPITQERQSLHSHLIEQVIKKCMKPIELTEEELHDIVTDGYFGMRMLEKKVDGNLLAGDKLYKVIYSTIINNGRVNSNIHLKREVKGFLSACDFPLIITTNCFPILEKELSPIYKDKGYFTKNNTNTKSLYENKEPLGSKCIYHIFGEASNANQNWGYSEIQIIEHLRTAMGSTPWSNLSAAIENKNLIVLGNNSPDWLFRFILTPVFGSNVYYHDGYYINSSNKEEDRHLIFFLRDITFSNSEQMDTILEKLTSKIQDHRKLSLRSDENRHRKEYDIFIAHASDDNKTIEKLQHCLENEHGLKVFVDYSEIRDGNYWRRIISALKNSAYFMPFITKAYINKADVDKMIVLSSFESLGINKNEGIPMDEGSQEDLDKVYFFSKYTTGVTTELLLAQKLLDLHPQDPYSLPIIQNGLSWLTPNHIEERLKAYRLFRSQQYRYYYDGKQDPFDGLFDYEKYKYLPN